MSRWGVARPAGVDHRDPASRPGQDESGREPADTVPADNYDVVPRFVVSLVVGLLMEFAFIVLRHAMKGHSHNIYDNGCCRFWNDAVKWSL